MYLCWKCGIEIENNNKEECTYCGAKKKIGQTVTNGQKIQQPYVRDKIHKERIAVMAMLVILIGTAFKIVS